MLNRLEVDQAVFFAMASLAWQFLAGPITIILIGQYFSKAVQGYYYTFWSILALQTVFDFSLHSVLVNFASHEWGKKGGSVTVGHQGDAGNRLASLLRGAIFGYGMVAVLFLIVVGGFGLAVLSRGQTAAEVSWRLPWLALVTVTSINFLTTPCLAILEGCGQVKSVYHLQFLRGILGNFAAWALMLSGASLWVTVAAAATRLICESAWVTIRHRTFFHSILAASGGPQVDWRKEIWPFQWRVGVRGLLGFANTFLINPVVFYYHGEVVAGQLGMTWQILTTLQAACMSWIRTRTMKLGVLVSQGQFAELDRIYFRLLRISLSILACGAIAFVVLIGVMNRFGLPLYDRMLPTLPTALFAIAIVALVIPESQWIYIHAHKKSPHLAIAAVGAVLSLLSFWWLGRGFGALGVAIAYLGMIMLFYLPLWSLVWWNFRAQQHHEPTPGAPGSGDPGSGDPGSSANDNAPNPQVSA
jgi:O-antigen/teichoic acid export membrane protein